ncbi:MAG TPA: type I phosphomannose isomerase catalytic subunit [Candidatus Tripitaka sp. YC43]
MGKSKATGVTRRAIGGKLPAPGYPLKFNGVFKEAPWGGDRLQKIFGKDTPQGKKIGESWEIVDRGHDNSLVTNGPCRGTTLHELMERRPAELLGVGGDEAVESPQARFPLLVKFLDVTDRLSLQVHPDDAYARGAGEEGGGKTEAWYVIQAESGSWIVYGLRAGVSLESFEERLRRGDQRGIESCLNFLSVRPGDTIFIPPGTLHAAGGGLLLLEVQQNSDLTYRVYDWGSNRPLHLEKALEVMKTLSGRPCTTGVHSRPTVNRPCPEASRDRSSALSTAESDGGVIELLLECKEFIMECLCLEGAYEVVRSDCHVLTFIKGSGDIYYGKGERLEAHAGDNVLIPAVLKGYCIQPKDRCKIVRTSLTSQWL